jgi:ADP-heptose:LPS heptosyltransferase
MTSPNPQKPPIVIIAYRPPGNRLEDTFKDLKQWFNDIIVVGPENSYLSQVVKMDGGSWVVSDSPHIVDLWEQGVRSQISSWYILIQDKEYLSTSLKQSLIETTYKDPVISTFNSFERKSFFLKKQMKYNLEWKGDPSSGLLYVANQSVSLNKVFDLKKIKYLGGELIHFGETNLNETIQNSIHRINWLADRLYLSSPCLTKLNLISGAIKNSLKNFYKTWFVRKGIREGFEGLVFCFLDAVVIILGYLKYYEKYIRSGRQIADNSDTIKKILVIKLRGLGDAVLATPVLENIKYFMPNVSISVLTFNFCKPLFENNPNINNLFGLSGNPEASELRKIKNILSAYDFDLIINLHARNFSSRLAKNIKARWRISGSSFIREKFTDVFIGSDHELDKSSIEKDLDCIRAIGLEPFKKQPELFVTEKEKEWAKEKLGELKIDPLKKLIMIHPTCSQTHKNWGMERFVELSQHLINDCGHQVMGIFSLQEQAVADLLKEQVDGVFVYVGPIRPSMALIQQADLMVDNCSGPSHISVALQVPTIVLMGVDFKNTYRDKSIYKDKHFLFFREVPCRDLFLSKCLPPDPCQNRICMDHSVQDVFIKAQELLIQ